MWHLHQTAKQASHYYSNTGDMCTNYRAEAEALLTATETVTQLETRPKKVVLVTYSLPVLQSLASGNPEDYTLRNVIQSLNSLTSRTTVVLQWIPAHTGIHGNEVADQLAKEGSKKKQPKSKLSYQEAKTLIRNKRLSDFKHINGGYNPQQDTLRLLSHHEQTMIFRLRTGHCRLRSHMKKMAMKSQPFVPTDWKHKPQPMSCRTMHLANRKFPRYKLHGTATDLKVRFISLTGLQL